MSKNPLGIIRNADGCIGNDIATADRPIGEMGVVVSGDITGVYEWDSWTSVDEFGRRFSTNDIHNTPTDHNQGGQLVNIKDPLDIELYIKGVRREDYNGCRSQEYCEITMVPIAIVGVWIKPYASRIVRKASRVVARKHGVSLDAIKVVKASDRVWEVYPGTYNSTYRRYENMALDFMGFI